jgi:putative component of membrane protein insertase Oxa1/YidC/SpoIIIJ protein YidD
VQQRGVIAGSVLTAWRILRCNPFTKGGVDEVKPGSSWFKVLDNGFVVPKPKKG